MGNAPLNPLDPGQFSSIGRSGRALPVARDHPARLFLTSARSKPLVTRSLRALSLFFRGKIKVKCLSILYLYVDVWKLIVAS